MPLQTALFTEAELPQFTSLAIASFNRGVVHLVIGKDTPENITEREAKMLKFWREDPKVKFVKCFDDSTGEIVAAAQWVCFMPLAFILD
jgi:hypothetical protein